MNKTPLLLTGILLCFLSACLPINKRIAVPVLKRSEPTINQEAVPDIHDIPDIYMEPLEHEVEVDKSQRVLGESLRLESDVAYRKLEEGLDSSAVAEDTAVAKRGSGRTVVGPQLSKEYIRARAALYRGRLRAWNKMVGRGIVLDMEDAPDAWLVCVKEIKGMAAGYQRLWQLSESGSAPGQSMGAAWGLLRRDIHFLEGGCDVMLQQANSRVGEDSEKMVRRSVDLAALLVVDYMQRGDYTGAIGSYENMLGLLPAAEIDFSLTWQYVQALSFSGRLAEARTVLHDTLMHKGVVEDEAFGSLSGLQRRALSRYADFLFISGEKVKAKRLYLRLDDDFALMERENDWVAGQLHFLADYGDTSEAYADYVDLLGRYVSSDGRGVPENLREVYAEFTKKYSEFGLLSGARRIIRRAEAETRIWGNKKLAEARMLVAENDFAGAKKILTGLHGLPDDMATDVEGVLVEIAAAQKAEVQNSKLREEEELAHRWREANVLLEQKKYDEAIVAFTSLQNSEYRLEAKRQLAQLIDEMVVSKRRRAANLFTQARRTRDVQKKKELFQRSRLLLVEMLRKYPEIDLAHKIRRNLAVLDQQIAEFDPDFLESLGNAQKK